MEMYITGSLATWTSIHEELLYLGYWYPNIIHYIFLDLV